jgi:hypothetical protein
MPEAVPKYRRTASPLQHFSPFGASALGLGRGGSEAEMQLLQLAAALGQADLANAALAVGI